MSLLDDLRRASADVAGLGRPWALVGGLAVSAYVEPRLTRDVDIAVAVGSDEEAEDVVARLQAGHWRLLALVEQDQQRDRLATVRLVPPSGSGAVLDVLFASSGIEAEVAAAAQVLEVAPRLRLPVALPGHLVTLKLLSRSEQRPQDAIDLRALLPLAHDEMEVADAAARLVVERGYQRGRDLPRLLVEAQAAARN